MSTFDKVWAETKRPNGLVAEEFARRGWNLAIEHMRGEFLSVLTKQLGDTAARAVVDEVLVEEAQA